MTFGPGGPTGDFVFPGTAGGMMGGPPPPGMNFDQIRQMNGGMPVFGGAGEIYYCNFLWNIYLT